MANLIIKTLRYCKYKIQTARDNGIGAGTHALAAGTVRLGGGTPNVGGGTAFRPFRLNLILSVLVKNIYCFFSPKFLFRVFRLTLLNTTPPTWSVLETVYSVRLIQA